MLRRIGSQEITNWAAIFLIEDEEMEKANKGEKTSQDDEDITEQLIAMIEADQAEKST